MFVFVAHYRPEATEVKYQIDLNRPSVEMEVFDRMLPCEFPLDNGLHRKYGHVSATERRRSLRR